MSLQPPPPNSELSEPPDYSTFVSTGAFRTRNIAEILRIAGSASLTRIELSSGVAWSPEMIDEVRSAASATSYLVHNYFPAPQHPFVLNLAAIEPDSLARSREHCRNAVALCAELGSPFYSVHSGFAFSASPEQLGHDLTDAPRYSLERAHEIFVTSLKEVCRDAGEKGVKIAIENNVLAPFNLIDGKNQLGLCVTADDMLQTISDVGAKNLGLLIDVAHLKVSANALKFDMHAFLDRVAPYVIAFHASDNDGSADTNHPVTNDSWFLARLAEFPAAVVILEAYSLEVDEIRANCEVIERARRRLSAVGEIHEST